MRRILATQTPFGGANERELDKEALKHVYWDEIQKCNEILQKRFKSQDKEKTGKI